jgi:hypothetical protein
VREDKKRRGESQEEFLAGNKKALAGRGAGLFILCLLLADTLAGIFLIVCARHVFSNLVH